MKQKKLIFNFFVNRNWKKLADSRKRAKILADNRKFYHPIETLFDTRHILNTPTSDVHERLKTNGTAIKIAKETSNNH